MFASRVERMTLDYLGAAADPEGKLLRNLSAVAASGRDHEYLWTASDEGRSLECLKREGAGYRLHDQVQLDEFFKHLAKKHNADEGLPEADIESLAMHDGFLWVCGSQCPGPAEAKTVAGRHAGRAAGGAQTSRAAKPASAWTGASVG
jgi:hypothetical protein